MLRDESLPQVEWRVKQFLRLASPRRADLECAPAPRIGMRFRQGWLTSLARTHSLIG